MALEDDAAPAPQDATLPELPDEPLDVLPKDAPAPADKPRRQRADKPATPAKPRARSKVDIAAGMTQLYTYAGIAITAIPSPPAKTNPAVSMTQAVGLAVGEQATTCGQAWAQLASENPQVKKALEQLLTTSAVVTLIGAHLPILAVAVMATGIGPGQLGPMLSGTASGETAR